jgi:hypothetical protein
MMRWVAFIFFWGGIARAAAPLPQLPNPLRAWLFYEQRVNSQIADLSLWAPVDIDDVVPPQYNPSRQPVFEVRHLVVPREELIVRIGANASEATRRLLIRDDGKINYYMHPDIEETMRSYIDRYGGLQGPALRGSPMAAVRAVLTTPEPGFDFDPVILKLSLPRSILKTMRTIDEDSLALSEMANRLIAPIADEMAGKHGVLFLPEVAQVSFPNTEYAFIVRQVPREMLTANSYFVPAFSLWSRKPRQDGVLVVNAIRKSGEEPAAFLRESIFRPIVRAVVRLTFGEGVIPQAHEENTLIELTSKQQPTKRIVLRDYEGFWTDPEMRILQGRSMEAFYREPLPFRRYMFNAAEQHYGRSYGENLRNTWCYPIEKIFHENRRELGISSRTMRRHEVWLQMDRVYLEEFVRAYGSDPIVPDLKPFIKSHQSELEEVFPHVNWDQPKLSPEDIGTLVERYGSQGLYLRKKQHQQQLIDLQPSNSRHIML